MGRSHGSSPKDGGRVTREGDASPASRAAFDVLLPLGEALGLSPEPALVTTAGGEVLYVDERFAAAWLGGRRDGLEGVPLADLLSSGASALLTAVVAHGTYDGEGRIVAPDGAEAELRLLARRTRNGDEGGERVVVRAEDATAARRLERAAAALGTSLDSGGTGGFFDRLAAGLEETLRMEMVLVGRLEPGEPRRVRALAVRLDGAPAAPFTYLLRGAPCEQVVGRTACVFPARVAELFPGDRVLAERGFASYVGVPLRGSGGEPLGLLAALSRRPLHDGASASRVLGLFAARAAAEIERREARDEEERLGGESRRLVDSIPVGLHRYRLEADGRLLLTGWNPAADAILGIDHRELAGLTIEEAFPSLAATEIPVAYRRAATDGASWHTEEVTYVDRRVSGAYLVQAFQTGPSEMAAAFLDVTDRRRAEEALREREARLERLNRILRSAARVREILAEAREAGDLVGRVCAALVEDRGYTFAWVGLLDDEGNEVRLAGASGPCDPDRYRIDLRTLHGGTDCARAAVLRGTAVLVEPGAPDAPCPGCSVSGSHPGQAALAMPLWRGDRSLGVLAVHASGPGVFDAEETRLVADLGDALAAALDRLDSEAQRAEARRDRAFRADVASAALREERQPALLAELADAAGRRLATAGVRISLRDGGRFRSGHAVGRGLLEELSPADAAILTTAEEEVRGRAWGTAGVPLRARLEPGLALAVWPLRDGDSVFGTLAGAWEAEPSRGTLEAGTDAVAPLALALAKARLLELNRERLATLLALHETGVDLGSSRERDELLRAIVARAEGLVRGTMAGLYLSRGDGTVELAFASGVLSGSLGAVLSGGEGVAGTVAKTREPILVDDYRSWPGRSPLFAAVDIGSVVGVPVLWRGDVLGGLFVSHEETGRFGPMDVETVRLFAEQAAVAIANARLIAELKEAADDLAEAYDATLEGWIRALDLRDEETEGHTQRVVERTVDLARRAGVPEEALVHVRRGALLHDIGKVGIPDRILRKPGPLTEEEWAVMRLHPTYAHEMLSGIGFLAPALEVPWAHHERWDGTGYPRGLAGESIPLAARAFAVVDIWDALVSDRPYRKALPEEEVRAYLRSIAGTHLDVRLVDLFLGPASG